MDILRCKTPNMVKNELTVHLLAYIDTVVPSSNFTLAPLPAATMQLRLLHAPTNSPLQLDDQPKR